MEDFKIVVFIMAILISLTAIANKRKLPYPILLVAAGLIIGFIPQLPNLALDPDVVFVIILPPLLYDAASKTSWHEFRTSLRPISALAITLVFFTTLTVAITAHYLIPGFSWPLSFVLGAVVSPPDAVAASGIIKGLGLNKKVITILEGESLVNDASALIAYRYAVAAVTTGTFIFWKAGLEFLLVAGVGILIGIVIGYLFVLAHKKIENNPVVETSLTLLSPFIAYLAAEQFHMSGVLAVVSTGLVISWRSPEVFSYQTRIRTRVVWDTLIFLLHGFVFILIGLQLPSIINDLGNYPFSQMLGYGLLISLVTIVVRIIWVFAGAYWQNFFRKKKKTADGLSENENSTWKNVLVVAWTGTRGVISLAAALALPLVLQDGTIFPKRHSIIFLAFVVIFVTLVVQGLSLPLLIRWLKIKPQDNAAAEEKELQLYLATSTLNFIEQELTAPLENKLQEQLKKKYEQLINDLTKEIRRHKKAKHNDEEVKPAPPDATLIAKLEISKFQRELLVRLHKEGDFSDAAIKKAEREMDIDELKLNLQVPKKE
ncbi:MAG TPA: Na+/H+ antiporter [Chitinophagaceae bacterium]|jgi:CPA1 family monovalent cation:H+ antiporter|nr:Na+/H+ antiporter [Chitinophagaceae bacterium]